MVFSGLVTACRFATWPTSRSPPLVIATMEGVSRDPSLLSSTVGSPASITATTELVVPRSMPIIFAMAFRLLKKCKLCYLELLRALRRSNFLYETTMNMEEGGATPTDTPLFTSLQQQVTRIYSKSNIHHLT